MGEEVRLDRQSILDHYQNKTGNPSDFPPFSEDSRTIQETIQKLLHAYRIRPNSNWERNIRSNMATPYWRLREWIFAQVLYSMLEDPKIILHMFGSTKPTSDIDVTVEAPYASDFIRAVETKWAFLTQTSTTQWAVEFYGDFLMFTNQRGAETYINTTRFDSINDKDILVYVGVSILRNAGTLNFDELTEILHSQKLLYEYPELGDKEWKQEAEKKYLAYTTLKEQEKRERYYDILKEAERLRDTAYSSNENKTKDIFMVLCEANMYRNENYILPSTVIHVVRDIQAQSQKPTSEKCSLYEKKLASCALGPFTYLCSALEQIGYMHKYENNPDKYNKYYYRYREGMEHVLEDKLIRSIHISEKRHTLFKGISRPPIPGSPFSEDPSFNNRSPSPATPSYNNPRGGKRRKTQRHKNKSQSKRRRSKTRK
jgi:hypothetical protein